MKPAPKLPVKDDGTKMIKEIVIWMISVAMLYVSIIIFSLTRQPCGSGDSTSTPGQNTTFAPAVVGDQSCALPSFSRHYLFETLVAWGFEIVGVVTIELLALWDRKELPNCCFERTRSMIESIRAGFHLLMTLIGVCLWGSSSTNPSAGAIGANMVAAAGSGLIYFLLEVIQRHPGRMEWWCSSCSCSWAAFKLIYFLPLLAMTGVMFKGAYEERHMPCLGLSTVGTTLFLLTSVQLVCDGKASKEHVSPARELSVPLVAAEDDALARPQHAVVEVADANVVPTDRRLSL